VNILHDINNCFIALVHVYYLVSKAEAQWPMAGRVVPTCIEVSPLVPAPPAKKGKWGAKALRKTGAWRAPHSASVRGRGRRSVKAMANRVLVDVEVGGSDELPLIIRQSFKDDRYSPSIEM
jgi:hypothetical protein